MLTRTTCPVFFVGLVMSLVGLLTACSGKQGYEAYCYASGGDGEGASKVYLCYQARSTCEKLQSKKAKIAEAHKDLHVGPCEKTTTMYCATPTTAGEQLVCGPSQASCDEVVGAAKASGRMASDCKEMSRADLDGLRKAEDERRKSAP
tara:strand:- start:14332 stop:14775 length:444 start_codon:yes stop_codon:yes gene_type:complete